MLAKIISLLISFGKIGLVSLGGGNSMLKLIEFEAVTSQHWLTSQEFSQMVGVTFLFPGLTALKLAALIGYQEAGISGMMTALIAICFPGLLMSVAGYQWFLHNQGPNISKVMIAVQYGALALLGAAVFSVAQGIFHVHFSWLLLIGTIVFFMLLIVYNLSPFWGLLVFIGIMYFTL